MLEEDSDQIPGPAFWAWVLLTILLLSLAFQEDRDKSGHWRCAEDLTGCECQGLDGRHHRVKAQH